jgi:hypothetical protein
MPVQFGNNLIQKIPLTAKLEYFSSNYFQIGQHVLVLLLVNYSKHENKIQKAKNTKSNMLCNNVMFCSSNKNAITLTMLLWMNDFQIIYLHSSINPF